MKKQIQKLLKNFLEDLNYKRDSDTWARATDSYRRNQTLFTIDEYTEKLSALMSSNPIASLETDILGEFLIKHFFTNEGLGCYENFNVRDYVKKLPDEIDSARWKVYEADFKGKKITMKYCLDGDGILEFSFDSVKIINIDCKKSYKWEKV